MIKIFVADDHTMFREMLHDFFATVKDIKIVDEAGDGEEALKKLKKSHYDVCLLDIDMPKMSGLEVLRSLNEEKIDTKVLILSTFADDAHVIEALKYGASGYIPKNEPSQELVRAVRKVAAGGKYLSSNAARDIVFHMIEDQDQPSYAKLSPSEYRVMVMVASGKKLKDIAREFGVSISTISTLRFRLLKKMKMKSNEDIIRYALTKKIIH